MNGAAWRAFVSTGRECPYCRHQDVIVITAINSELGDVVYWLQEFGTDPWYGKVVAVG